MDSLDKMTVDEILENTPPKILLEDRKSQRLMTNRFSAMDSLPVMKLAEFVVSSSTDNWKILLGSSHGEEFALLILNRLYRQFGLVHRKNNFTFFHVLVRSITS